MSFTYYKTIRLSIIIGCGLLFIVFAIASCFQIYVNLSNDNIWFNDFFGLWSYANFELKKSVSDIYNNDIMLELQMDPGACCVSRMLTLIFLFYIFR
jgi:hypothetical protein